MMLQCCTHAEFHAGMKLRLRHWVDIMHYAMYRTTGLIQCRITGNPPPHYTTQVTNCVMEAVNTNQQQQQQNNTTSWVTTGTSEWLHFWLVFMLMTNVISSVYKCQECLLCVDIWIIYNMMIHTHIPTYVQLYVEYRYLIKSILSLFQMH